MGIVVAGGLLFSLVLTLYVIPAVYTFISKESLAEDLQYENIPGSVGEENLIIDK